MTRGERVIQFIERYLKVPEGALVGQPLRLEPFQKKFIRAIYDNPQGTRRAYLSIARKNGKSGLIAGILLAHIAGPEAIQNSQIVSGAMSRDQAALVFNLAAKMVQMSPELSERVRIVPSSKRLIGLSKAVEYRALAAEGRTAHGLSPVLAILDEVGQVRGPQSDFIDAITTAQGAHSAPLLIAISTQAPNDADLFSVWLDDAAASNDPRIVCHLYAADKDADVMDRAGWAAANPAMGTFRSLPDLQEQAERAARMPSFEATFRNLMLNQRVELTAPFVSRNVWQKCGESAEDAVFYEETVYLGLDLSARNDLTAAVLMAFDGEKWHVQSHFWTPAEGISDRAKADRAPYDVWTRDGLIRATPGASIDYAYVARDLAEILDGMTIEAVAFDRWRFDLLQKELTALGLELPLRPFGQGFRDMAPAVDTLESLLLNGRIRHGNHPVLTMCMANAKVEQDAAGNRKLNKAKSTGRIDGAVALTMAAGMLPQGAEVGDFEDYVARPLVL